MRGDARGPDTPGRRDDAERNPLADVRPVGPAAVLDGGIDLLRHRFGRLIALTACLYLPVWLFDLSLVVFGPVDATDRTGTLGGPAAVLFDSGAGSTLSGWVYVVGALQMVALSLLGLAVGHLAAALVAGRDATLGELAGVLARRWWVALLILPLNAVVHAASACLGGIGWFIGDAFVFMGSVVAGAERIGPVAAWLRGIRLSTAEFGRALVISFGGVVITVVIQTSLSFGPAALVASLDPSSPLVTLVVAAGAAVVLVTEPLAACIAARAYVDLRCRVDGWDLELRRARLLRERADPVTTA